MGEHLSTDKAQTVVLPEVIVNIGKIAKQALDDKFTTIN